MGWQSYWVTFGSQEELKTILDVAKQHEVATHDVELNRADILGETPGEGLVAFCWVPICHMRRCKREGKHRPAPRSVLMFGTPGGRSFVYEFFKKRGIDINYYHSGVQKLYHKEQCVPFELDTFDPMSWEASQAPEALPIVKDSITRKKKSSHAGKSSKRKQEESPSTSSIKKPKVDS